MLMYRTSNHSRTIVIIGTIKDPDKPPRSWQSCKDQAALDKWQKAIERDKMVRNIIRSYTKDREQGWNYDLVMENPLGSLRQRPYNYERRSFREGLQQDLGGLLLIREAVQEV